MRRSERLLYYGEATAYAAHKDKDFRLLLQAIDKARGALELSMKARGVIGGDASDNRKQTINVFSGKSAEELEGIIAALVPLAKGAQSLAPSAYLQEDGKATDP
ncbi:MAG: hypothetical protein KGL39_22080 [Patescibacteria group bacterium]|nr:hypothetical protein [Patescibacteria group bacterium]